MTVLEEVQTGLFCDGKRLCRRVYLATSPAERLPVDAAPGSIALVRESGKTVLRILFPDGKWEEL